ncbi:mitochondrial 37S ribosomal protein uS8m [Calcarisporiella thermophila]|uniref:mitochondrial 37S ribosomal protein uS8m n=1 Tax=Calcarisporiella thermophila TaxID=911321 RepID=UPI00374319B7
MPLVHDLCARIQNGFRARLQHIAIPDTKMNLAISNILYREGFVGAVVRGDHTGPDPSYTSTTPANIATRRLWLTLKYRDELPVLSRMRCISKPSKRVMLGATELKDLASGRRAKFVEPLQSGEIAIVSTNRGVMELQEALQKNVGGEILCRVR